MGPWEVLEWMGILVHVIFAFFVFYLLYPNTVHTDKVLKQNKTIIEIIRERFNLIYTGLKFNNAFIRKSAGTHTNITKDTQTGHYCLPQTKSNSKEMML